jgi:hypothetical protein
MKKNSCFLNPRFTLSCSHHTNENFDRHFAGSSVRGDNQSGGRWKTRISVERLTSIDADPNLRFLQKMQKPLLANSIREAKL